MKIRHLRRATAATNLHFITPGVVSLPVEAEELPAPEMVQPDLAPDVLAPGDDRIKAKIADVIKSRVRSLLAETNSLQSAGAGSTRSEPQSSSASWAPKPPPAAR